MRDSSPPKRAARAALPRGARASGRSGGAPDPLQARAALIAEAQRVLGKFALVKPSISAGGVACALETASGRIYTGICLDLACGIGFCAEHAAVAEMLKARETAIRRIVAIDDEGVLAPCGRCRELIVQVDRENLACEVILPGDTSARMADLLPRAWLEPLFARD